MTPRTIPAALLLLSIAVLATVYGAQHLGGLRPCELCLYQRWPWWIAAGLALAALVPGGAPADAARRVLVAAAGLVLIAGAVLAGYHVGVEQGWWQGPASCGGAIATPETLAELRAQLSQTVVPCGEPAWSLFGISMAGYNAILSAAAGLAALAGARRRG